MKTAVKGMSGLVAAGVACFLVAGMSRVVAGDHGHGHGGDHGWATAGKILTGVVVADILFNHLPRATSEPTTTRVVETTYVVPASSVTYVETRVAAPRIYTPPVVYTTTYCPPPVVYAPVYCPPPVYYRPASYVGWTSYGHGSSFSIYYSSGSYHGGYRHYSGHGARPYQGHRGGYSSHSGGGRR